MLHLVPLVLALALWGTLAVVRDREQAREVAAEDYVQQQAFIAYHRAQRQTVQDIERASVAFLAEHAPAFRDTLEHYEAYRAELTAYADSPRMQRVTDDSAHLARIEARLGVTRAPEDRVVEQVRVEGPGREAPLQPRFEIRRSGLADIPPEPFHALLAVLALIAGLFGVVLRPGGEVRT